MTYTFEQEIATLMPVLEEARAERADPKTTIWVAIGRGQFIRDTEDRIAYLKRAIKSRKR